MKTGDQGIPIEIGMSDWQRVEEIVHGALEHRPGERSNFVRDACGSDDALRREVESLLANASLAEKSTFRIGELGMDLVGQQVGVYRVDSRIGAGGMGEVYRARDTKLGRDVAIKVLPSAFLADAERQLRFEREARVLASLNHPCIASIYGFEQTENVRCLVLELVEGPTLAERIAQGPLSVREVLRYARQIAEGLEAAHQKGIVHRDLKPANIKITAGDGVKILDFGLAKAAAVDASGPDLSHSPTITVGATRSGMLLGTAAYMSPEQARGRPVDTRADIWAFGCVLYEMLARTSAFGRETLSDTIVAILEHEPDWRKLPHPRPAGLDRVLVRCLAKDPTRRLRDIADTRFDLEDEPPSVDTQALDRAGKPRRWPGNAAIAVSVASLAAALLVARGGVGRNAGDGVATRIEKTVATVLTNYDGTEAGGAISPDGRSFVFVADMGGTPDIWLRQIAGGEPVRLTNDAAVESNLAYAPDGESIYFARAEGADTSVWRIGALGGQARRVLGGARSPSLSYDGQQIASFTPLGGGALRLQVSGIDGGGRRDLVDSVQSVVLTAPAAWSPDGRQLAYTSGGLFAPRNLFVVNVGDGSVRQVTRFTRSAEGTVSQAWLPDSRYVLVSYSSSPGALAAQDLGVVDLTNGEITRLTANVGRNFYAPSLSSEGSRLIVTSNEVRREVWKVPFGADPVANGREATRLLDASVDPMWTYVTRDGRMLLYNNAVVGSRNLWTMPLDRSARARQITSVPGDAVMHSSLSPDTTHVAFASSATGNSDIWVQHVDGSGLRQLTNDAAADAWPVWSPDGLALMFASLSNGSWETRRISLDGRPSDKVVDGFFRGDWISKPGREGAWIVTADDGGGVRLMDLESRAVLWRDGVQTSAMPMFSPDARLVSLPVRESRDRDAIWVYDVATGKPRVAARFSEPFQMFFRASWVDDGRAFIVNRGQTISHVVMFDRFWTTRPPDAQ